MKRVFFLIVVSLAGCVDGCIDNGVISACAEACVPRGMHHVNKVDGCVCNPIGAIHTDGGK